jgi:Domain of unknown function (DUF5666)
MHLESIAAHLIILSSLAAVSVFGASGDRAEVKGMITKRTGETLNVKSADGDVTVALTDDTRTKDDKGVFGLEQQQMADVVLIPGLKVDVEGVFDDQGRVIATTITVDGDDLEAAEKIEPGLRPTEQQVAANLQALEAQSVQIAAHHVQLAAQRW